MAWVINCLTDGLMDDVTIILEIPNSASWVAINFIMNFYFNTSNEYNAIKYYIFPSKYLMY